MGSEEQLAEARREIEELKHALEECSAKAQSATEEMQHFIYAVSHDLRQPLRSVSSFAQLLQRQHAGDQQASEMTSSIIDGAREMNALIEDLLKYSRISTSPKRTLMNLKALAQWAWLSLQAQANECQAEIRYGNLPEVAVDESQFVQLFQQLLSNCLKFRSAEPPRIDVTAEEDAHAYTICVRDNGSGIEPKYQEMVFTPFKRLHGREVPGTGLGLSICRKIVRAHGGRMWVESDGSHGSAFKFTVPL